MPNTTPPDIAHALKLKPAEAIKYFESKGLQLTDSWNELMGGQHIPVLTVAHLGKLDVLQRVYSELRNALHEGLTEAEFERRLTPVLQAAGWWGKAIDADTGEITQTYPGSSRAVQYGSPARLDLIYRQNLQTAYMVGRYQGLSEGRHSHPYWQYIAIKDSRTRPSHAALNGRVFRREDPAFDSLYPPNGWNCRCRTRPLSDSRLKREGLEVDSSAGKLIDATVPAGRYPDGSPKTAEVTGIRTGRYDADGKEIVLFPDAGWSYHPGTSWQMAQRQQLHDKQAELGNAGITLPDTVTALTDKVRRVLGEPLTAAMIANPKLALDDIRISDMHGIDPDLTADKPSLQRAEAYIRAIAGRHIFKAIAAGNLRGNAALQHEIAEAQWLNDHHRDFLSQAGAAKILDEYLEASGSGIPEGVIDYHLHALKAEIQYTSTQLQQHGIHAELGMIAKALYGHIGGEPLTRTVRELQIIGIIWPEEAVPPALQAAITQPRKTP
ncbi:MAG: hypothetical protein BWK73_13975 [Thiothrix lacustris]|uniref:Phage head morphogenesis domain-containing protein n=1 Tax=Thiothrix lacustris TaxID=525917 RepID=A0A1Y1QSI4_9GAMM|nr:MAG: hypothetical protein BWK73_13975 [Thiothrix lacustris]